MLLSKIATFLQKREFFSELPRKCFKTTENHSLGVCDNIFGGKQCLVIFVPIYWFDKKKLFRQILILLRIQSIQTCLEKQNI